MEKTESHEVHHDHAHSPDAPAEVKHEAHGSPTTEEVHQESHGSSAMDLFKIEPGLTLWTWITFLVLFFILKKFAWKPLVEAVEKREKTISDAVEDARKTKEALENLSEEHEKMRAESEQSAREILRQGKEAGEKIAREIEEKARGAADEMLEHARQQIGEEKEKAVAALKEEAVDMVIQTSAKLVEKSLDDEAHRKIVKQHLEAL